MQKIGCANRHILGRRDNVVVIDFRVPDPPSGNFPGAGALRTAAADKEQVDIYFEGALRGRFRPKTCGDRGC